MQRMKGFQTEKKQNNLFLAIVWKNMWYNRKETILLIICEMLIVAIAYSGSMCYQILSAKHSSEVMLLQEDGISRQFVYAGMLLLFCGIVLIITVMVSYLGKRIPQYMLLKRMGISSTDTKKMIAAEAGICYVIASIIGFFAGKGLFLIFRKLIPYMADVKGELGGYSKLTYSVICLVSLGIYGLSFLLMKELEADFRIITSTQESVRKEKLAGKFPVGKLAVGILCCSYAVMQYRKIYNHESIYLLALFFAGTYLIVRSSMALILNNIRNRQERKYYRHLLQRNKLYYRSKTAARYGVLFFVLSFLVCFYFGFQVISVATAEPVSSLYPYDFMCIADDKDEKLLRNLEKTYQSDISITEYPMVRVATADKTERVENGSERRIQGQEIGISETTYHRLKKALNKNYKAKQLNLDTAGKKVYLVHQQDRSVKAQPIDWFYGKSRPNLHVGVPATEYDSRDKKNTYIERVVSGEEIGSLTGCYSTEKSENIVVFSDTYFEKAGTEWKRIDAILGIPIEDAKSYYGESTVIQGPTKLVLISVKSGINNRNSVLRRIDQSLEKKEEAHKYIGNYDSTVRFHYDSETAKADMTSERAVKILINSYLMIMLVIIDMIIFYTMCQMELREITLRERFLKNMGMNEKERRKIYRKEISFYYYLPACMLVVALGLFLRAVLKARMFPETIAQMCIRLEVLLTVGVLFLRMLYVVTIYQIFSRKAGMRDER